MSEQSQVCDNCKKLLPSSKIATHYGYCRKNVKKCQKCGQMYDINFQEQHQEQFHRKQKCNYCKRDIPSGEFQNHQKSCHLKPKYCQYCQQNIPSTQYNTHLKACQSRTKVCELCGKDIMHKDYIVHSTACTGPDIVQQPKNYTDHISKQREKIEPNIQPSRRQQFNNQDYKIDKNERQRIQRDRFDRQNIQRQKIKQQQRLALQGARVERQKRQTRPQYAQINYENKKQPQLDKHRYQYDKNKYSNSNNNPSQKNQYNVPPQKAQYMPPRNINNVNNVIDNRQKKRQQPRQIIDLESKTYSRNVPKQTISNPKIVQPGTIAYTRNTGNRNQGTTTTTTTNNLRPRPQKVPQYNNNHLQDYIPPQNFGQNDDHQLQQAIMMSLQGKRTNQIPPQFMLDQGLMNQSFYRDIQMQREYQKQIKKKR